MSCRLSGRVGGQLHAPGALPEGKKPGTHCTVGWTSPTAYLEACREEEISCPHRGRNPEQSSP
jgi:hypothetical protein